MAPKPFLIFTSSDGDKGFLFCKCQSTENSVLVVPAGSSPKLAGIFSFQALYGTFEAHEYIFSAKKYSPSNYISISFITNVHIPLTFVVRDDLMKGPFNESERVSSRIREFITSENAKAIIKFINDNYPSGILLLKHEDDFASRFIRNNFSEHIFRPKQNFRQLARLCYLVNPRKLEEASTSQNPDPVGSTCDLDDYNHQAIVGKIIACLNEKKMSTILITGPKNAGKSTLMRYLVNSLKSIVNDSSEQQKYRVFLLDSDVGQSELYPPGKLRVDYWAELMILGTLSLTEINFPLFGCPHATSSKECSITHGYYFGSNTPSVDIGLYTKMIDRLLSTFVAISNENCEKFVLFVNTVGWIEDVGYELMCTISTIVKPDLHINIKMENTINFQVPKGTSQIIELSTKRSHSAAFKPSVLREITVAGYFARCFSAHHRKMFGRIKLADIPPYRVNFNSISVFYHPELRNVPDHLIMNSLNCMIVGLCRIEEGFESNYEYERILNDQSLPNRIRLKNPIQDEDNNELQSQPYPMLRCFGFGKIQIERSMHLIRRLIPIISAAIGLIPSCALYICIISERQKNEDALVLIQSISLERKIFYVLTPVALKHLQKQVNIFAVGFCFDTPDMIFYTDVELGEDVRGNHKKLYSPLGRVGGVTGLKRALCRNKKDPLHKKIFKVKLKKTPKLKSRT